MMSLDMSSVIVLIVFILSVMAPLAWLHLMLRICSFFCKNSINKFFNEKNNIENIEIKSTFLELTKGSKKSRQGAAILSQTTLRRMTFSKTIEPNSSVNEQ
jgi:hypothetical protein